MRTLTEDEKTGQVRSWHRSVTVGGFGGRNSADIISTDASAALSASRPSYGQRRKSDKLTGLFYPSGHQRLARKNGTVETFGDGPAVEPGDASASYVPVSGPLKNGV